MVCLRPVGNLHFEVDLVESGFAFDRAVGKDRAVLVPASFGSGRKRYFNFRVSFLAGRQFCRSAFNRILRLSLALKWGRTKVWRFWSEKYERALFYRRTRFPV